MTVFSDTRAVEPAARWAGPLAVLVSVAAAALVFWPGLVGLVDAWSTPEYSHGPLIPLISLFLFLREMRGVPPVDYAVVDRWPGVAVLTLGLLLGLLGAAVRIPDLTFYALIVWTAGMLLVSFGLRRGVRFWPAVLHLIFMLPLPQFVYWQVSVFLQLISSQIGVGLIRLADIPVYLDGNVIDLGVYKLQVAEACSGLRYLFPMLSFSYVFAVLYQGPRWHKVVLLLSAAPITVAMNAFRIGVIGVLVNSYGIEQAEGFLHTFEGWIIFVACVLILFAEATLLQRLSRDPRPLSETLDIEFEGLGAQLRRVAAVAPSAALGAAALLTVAAAGAWTLAPDRTPAEVRRDPLVLFPGEIARWTAGPSQTLDRGIARVLGADDYFLATYAQDSGAPHVDFFVAYYHRLTEGSGIHSPEVCIPVGGWEVSRWDRIELTLADGRRVPVNRAVIQKGVVRHLVYYWFEQRGRRMTNDYAAKLATVWDGLTRGRTDGGLVRLITPIDPQEGERAADRRLQGFVEAVVDTLPRFVPG